SPTSRSRRPRASWPSRLWMAGSWLTTSASAPPSPGPPTGWRPPTPSSLSSSGSSTCLLPPSSPPTRPRTPRSTASPESSSQLRQLVLSADAVVHLHAAVNSQVHRLTGEILDAEVAGPWKGTQPHRELAAWVPRAGLSFENTARLLTLAESLVLGRQEGSLLR